MLSPVPPWSRSASDTPPRHSAPQSYPSPAASVRPSAQTPRYGIACPSPAPADSSGSDRAARRTRPAACRTTRAPDRTSRRPPRHVRCDRCTPPCTSDAPGLRPRIPPPYRSLPVSLRNGLLRPKNIQLQMLPFQSPLCVAPLLDSCFPLIARHSGAARISVDDYALSSGGAIGCLYATFCVARHALRTRLSKSFSMVLRLSL